MMNNIYNFHVYDTITQSLKVLLTKIRHSSKFYLKSHNFQPQKNVCNII